VIRAADREGRFYADLIGLADESTATMADLFETAPFKTSSLLLLQFSEGRPHLPRPALVDSRRSFLESLLRFDSRYKELENPAIYPALLTVRLKALLNEQKKHAGDHQRSTDASE
jgi:hypothetical protein